MKVKATGRKVNLKQTFIDMVTKRLQKFDRFFEDEAEATVAVTVEKNRQTVEVTVRSRGFLYRAERTAADMETAFADAVDLLDGDIFEAGYHYMISGSLVAEKGYVFAENLTITVNGIPSNIDLGDLGVINLGDTAFLGHSFGLLQQSVQEPDPTGDSIGIVIALLICSAGAWLTLKKRR